MRRYRFALVLSERETAKLRELAADAEVTQADLVRGWILSQHEVRRFSKKKAVQHRR